MQNKHVLMCRKLLSKNRQNFLVDLIHVHLLSCGFLQTVIEVSNILAWCKALADMYSFVLSYQKLALKLALKLAISLLKSYISDKAVVTDLS